MNNNKNQNKIKRILYLSSYLDKNTSLHYKYGYAHAGLNKKRGIIQALQENNIETIVISPLLLSGWLFKLFKRKEYKDEAIDTIVYYPSLIRWFPPFNILFLILSACCLIYRFHKKKKIDAVIFYNWHINLVIPAIFTKVVLGAYLILEYEDSLFAGAKYRIIRLIASLQEKIFNGLIDAAILNTVNFKNRIKTNKYTIIRGVINKESQNDFTKKNGKIIIMFAATIDEVRGIDTFIKVCSLIGEQNNIEMWITGSGSEKCIKKLLNQIEEINIKNIKYYGFLPFEQYKRKLQRADILVNFQKENLIFSKYCFPSKIIEFMNMKKIILSTNISDILAIAKDKIVVCEDSPELLYGKIMELIENIDKYRAYGERAYKWAQENCTIPIVAKKLNQLFLEFTKRND